MILGQVSKGFDKEANGPYQEAPQSGTYLLDLFAYSKPVQCGIRSIIFCFTFLILTGGIVFWYASLVFKCFYVSGYKC